MARAHWYLSITDSSKNGEYQSWWFLRSCIGKNQSFAWGTWSRTGIRFAPSKKFQWSQGTAVEKIFNANAVGVASDHLCTPKLRKSEKYYQDTTGLMTFKNLNQWPQQLLLQQSMMYQSGCHGFSLGFKRKLIFKTDEFMNKFANPARDPRWYPAMTDVIHKVLNDITIDDWAITLETLIQECQKVLLLVGLGTVALALATGEARCQFPNQLK